MEQRKRESTSRNKTVVKNHIEGPQGVRGRNSDNTFIEQSIGWKPSTKLIDGIRKTYEWINREVLAENHPTLTGTER